MIRNLIYQFITLICIVIGAVALDVSGVKSNWVWAGMVMCCMCLMLWMIATESEITNSQPLRYRLLSKLLLANGRWLTIKLLEFAMRFPYNHLDGYMHRWWLLKHPAKKGQEGHGTFSNWLLKLLPVYARFHHVLRPDRDRNLHDHPFEFTSIILRGWYMEERLLDDGTIKYFCYGEGDINQVKPGEFHRITDVSESGVLTLVFHTRRYEHSWGFLVNGERIHWRTYLGLDKAPVNIFEENT